MALTVPATSKQASLENYILICLFCVWLTLGVVASFPQLPSFSSSGPPRSSSWWTARRSDVSSCCWNIVLWRLFLICSAMTDDFPSSGMAGLVGGRCLLASAVLHHPPGDHGAAAALRQQPEVSRAGIREEFLYFRVHLLTGQCWL